MTAEQENGTPKKPEEKEKLSPNVILASVVTVVALVAYGVAIFVLWGKADTAKELDWSRWVFLLAGIEPIAFAGAGWLFGREVNRVRAEKAEAKAEDNQAEADTAKERATKAIEIGKSVQDALGGGGESGDRLGTRGGGGGQPDVGTAARIARRFDEL